MKTGSTRPTLWPAAVWAVGRSVLLLFALKVFVFPGPDVTSDVSVIYQGWYEVLRTGAFPSDDVTWQYPPAAALAILAPGILPFLDYPTAFFALACLADLSVFALLARAARGPERGTAGLWVWVVGVPLLGPTVYARYDVMVTAVAVAALLAAARRPRLAGALAAFGALLKVWPALVLLGVRSRIAWIAAAITGLGATAVFALAAPGSLAFLTFQRERGTEVESLGALVFHVARPFGWRGQVSLNYGSVEFLGPGVETVSKAALALTGLAFGWLLLWRLWAVRFRAHTVADAAFVGVLLFVTTSRVISPQYLVWLVGLAAVCLCHRADRMRAPAVLVLAASLATVLEFPIWFGRVVAGDALGVAVLFVRNGLLVAATLTAAVILWRDTVPGRATDGPPSTDTRAAPETPAASR
ncbi:glycosyltransferase 87 family protein [Streptomyces sp. HSG2]|uniref:glycosyltransferase 87 family protein n=1 Tax=Streptomyces sp. HSG2 TaxID=2797167 RepID=UPI001F5C06D3|nr:glycosyltransferase 87 family protein [Streptomyces sp. HSG2]